MAKTVLVIDDDPAIISLATQFLHKAGYEACSANTGADALRLFNQKCPKIIITDLAMPEMDGLDLCRAIRSTEAFGCVYIVALSAYEEGPKILEAFEAGVDDFLGKPFNEQQLIARLQAGERLLKLEDELAQDRMAIYKANAELMVLNNRLQQVAITDDLTRLANRREAMRRIEELWSVASRQGTPLSCLLIDIDHFKRCNDIYGHAVGDKVLRGTARQLQDSARQGETVCRMGGEEFLILCPGSTAEDAVSCGERVRLAIESNKVYHYDLELSVTVSIGVAEVGPNTESFDAMLRQADDALYRAKREGRNRVCLASHAQTDEALDEKQLQQWVSGEMSQSPTKVLVVDDDQAIRLLCGKLLDQDGYTVVEAVDGVDALEKIKQERPDIILMDIEMPRMDGLECSRQLKANPVTKDIPLIIISGRSSEQDIQAGLDVHADEYITKPLDRKAFLYRVRSMARLQRNKAELIQSNEVRGVQARALGILLDLSRSISVTSDLNSALDKIISAAAELTACRRISIMLPDQTGTELEVVRSIGIEKKVARNVRIPIGGKIAGRVYLSRKPVLINDAQETKENNEKYDAQFFVSTPLVSTALRTTERVVGVLNITERYDGRAFQPLDLEYIDLICNIAASAIDGIESRRARDDAYNSIVVALARLAEHRDTDTGKHLDRVTSFAVLLAKELATKEQYREQIDDDYISDLQRSVPLHDIGKVAIPDRILLKPGKLTDDEMSIMRSHVEMGAQTIRSVIEQNPHVRFLKMALEVIEGHHEWYNGGGYPHKIKGEQIPLAARITGLADVYDALTTARPYKDPYPHEKAVSIIRLLAGTQFDPAVIEAFFKLETRFEQLAAELSDEAQSRKDRSQPLDGHYSLLADAG